jgi:hypothetical protein
MRAIIEPEPPPEPGQAAGPVWKRLLWFAGLAVASAAMTATAAYAMRALLFAG